MGDYLQERLNRAREEGLRRRRSRPTPTFQGFQDGELLVSIDGKPPEQYGRYLGTGTPAIGDPLVEYRGAGGPLLRGSDRRPTTPERRVIVVAAPPTGEWVFSNNEGLPVVLQNDNAVLHFTYNTRPNTTLHSDIQQVFAGDDLSYNVRWWMRSVDFAFARYLTVTVPTRIAITYSRDHLMARYDSAEFSSANPHLFFRAYMMSATQPPLTSPNNILDDAIARYEAGEIFLDRYITNDFVPPELSQPWNRHWILRNQINNPVFGIDYQYALTGSTSTSEGTFNFSLDLYDPGTYLLLGTLGTQTYNPVEYFGGLNGDTIPDPADPNSNMIWWMQLDTTVAIAPIPEEPPPEP